MLAEACGLLHTEGSSNCVVDDVLVAANLPT